MSLGVGFEISKDLPNSQATFLCLLFVDPDVSSQLFLLPHPHSTTVDSNPLKPHIQFNAFCYELPWSWSFVTETEKQLT